jgi:hypothetical protein
MSPAVQPYKNEEQSPSASFPYLIGCPEVNREWREHVPSRRIQQIVENGNSVSRCAIPSLAIRHFSQIFVDLLLALHAADVRSISL